MSLTPEERTLMNALRIRSVPGHPEPPSLDEMKWAIIKLRETRTAALTAASTSKVKKPKTTPVAVGDALADLENF